jgi:glutamine synthetase
MHGPVPGLVQEAEAFLAKHPSTQAFALVFTDLCGVQRGKLLRRDEVLAAYRNGRFLPISIMSVDITGRDVEETGLIWETGDADQVAWPVAGTLVPVPWAAEESAQFLVSIRDGDGRPCIAEPRNVLARVVERFAALDLTPVAAIELEFYLMDRAAALAGRPQPPRGLVNEARPRHFHAYLLQDLDDFAPFFRDLYAMAEAQGLPVKTLISEYSPGQVEITLLHRADALRACDEAILFKRLVKALADRHGMIASFMAKPYAQYSGSGMHVHTSLTSRDGGNAFAAEEPAANPLLLHAVGGLKATMAEGLAIFAPNANSYRRFRKRSYAPVAPNWGVNNRTVSIRIPAGPPAQRHIEHRPAGADANPYLVLAAVLAGMHHGIAARLDPGAPAEGNAYLQPAPAMPTNWFAAIEALRASTVLRDYLGERLVDIFCTIKEAEADRFFAEPQRQDFDWYLRTV